MKKSLISLIKHPMLSGSSIVLIGSFLGNILNWIFNLYIGGRHLLSPADYGTYSALISILGFIGIIQVTFTSIFAKYAARFSAKDDKDIGIAVLFAGGKVLFFLSAGLTILLFLFSEPLAIFLHIGDTRLIWLMLLSLFLSLLSALPAGVLQGELRFFVLSTFLFATAFFKMAFGLFFIFLGMNIYGVMIAVFLATLLPFLFIAGLVLQKYIGIKRKKYDESVFFKEFRGYSVHFFLATIGITILSSMDIVFVKHFFTPGVSGYYAALSIMGKSIFYLTSPIYYVFFPIIAQKNERKENVNSTLFLTMGTILLISTSLSVFYFLFPGIILKIFFPSKEYAFLSAYLGYYSIFVTIFSLVMLFNNFLLSIGRTRVYIINLLGGGLFILFISLFHQSLANVIMVLIAVSLLLLVSQITFYYSKK